MPVVSLGDGAFPDIASVTSVTIGSSVTNIGTESFANFPNLTGIFVDSLNSVFSSLDGVLFNKGQTTLIQYPGGKSGTYTVPNTVTNVASSAFENCSTLTNVIISDSVATIGSTAFHACVSLT